MAIVLANRMRMWHDPKADTKGVTYWCQGCNEVHSIKTKGPGAWTWNGDAEKPVFSPSVNVTYDVPNSTPKKRHVCHTFVGCNGAQPGQVAFLGDCTHALANTVQPFSELPEWLR